MNTQIISLSNQKGGVGKTTTCANLGIGLAREGKRVLLVDCDPQASLTLSLGWRKPETLPVTLATLMGRVLQEQPVHAEDAILHHAEGVDLIPGSIALCDPKSKTGRARTDERDRVSDLRGLPHEQPACAGRT